MLLEALMMYFVSTFHAWLGKSSEQLTSQCVLEASAKSAVTQLAAAHANPDEATRRLGTQLAHMTNALELRDIHDLERLCCALLTRQALRVSWLKCRSV